MLTHEPHLPHLCQGKAVGRRSELNAGTLASLLQWAEVELSPQRRLQQEGNMVFTCYSKGNVAIATSGILP
jgi:hypothetical protein